MALCIHLLAACVHYSATIRPSAALSRRCVQEDVPLTEERGRHGSHPLRRCRGKQGFWALNLSGGLDVSEKRKKKNSKLEISRILAIYFSATSATTYKAWNFLRLLCFASYLAVLKGEMLIDCSVAARAVTVAADWNVAKTHRSHSRSFSCETGGGLRFFFVFLVTLNSLNITQSSFYRRLICSENEKRAKMQ